MNDYWDWRIVVVVTFWLLILSLVAFTIYSSYQDAKRWDAFALDCRFRNGVAINLEIDAEMGFGSTEPHRKSNMLCLKREALNALP